MSRRTMAAIVSNSLMPVHEANPQVQKLRGRSISSQNVQLAFASAMTVLLVTAGLAYRSSVQSVENDWWVRHTHEVVETLQDLALNMRTIESSARGFVVTGDDSYVGDYHFSIVRAAQDQELFGTLTVDNLKQQRRLPDLARLAAAKIQLAEAIIGLRRDQGFDAAVDATRKGAGQRLMTDFLSVVDGAKSEELRLLTIRDADSQRTKPQAKFGLILTTVLGLVVTAGAGWSVQRDDRRRKLAEEALFAEKERAEVTLNSIGDAVASTDVDGDLTYLNPTAEEMSGWPSEEAVGRPMPEVLQILDGATHETIPNPMEKAIAANRRGSLPPNSVFIRRDGLEIPIEDSVAPIHDREGEPAGAVIAFRDVTVARKLAQHMTYAAEHDFLTDLPNRVLFNDRVNQAIASALRYGKLVAVLFIDLDGFKQINDSWGHAVGDQLLQSVAKRLVGCVRSSDTVNRQGGEEFLALLSEVQHLDDAAIIAGRMLAAVAEAHFIDQHELHVRASIGVAVYPDDGPDAAILIKNADTAMYRAKASGAQSYQFFRPVIRAIEPT
jgi:diguanylate cyclase (GGDEF)-like protein/PAS domain S-box-containing protein